MNHASRRTIQLVLGALLLAGCGSVPSTPTGGSPPAASPSATPSMTFPAMVDSCGQKVTVFTRPEKIMAVGNVAVDTIVAAGGADRITVRPATHDGPPVEPYGSAVAGAKVINGSGLSPETIIGSGVDTVISYGLSSDAGLVESRIASLTVASQCENHTGSLEEIYAQVLSYGALFGTQDKASAAVEDMKRRVAAVAAKARRPDLGRRSCLRRGLGGAGGGAGQAPAGGFGALGAEAGVEPWLGE